MPFVHQPLGALVATNPAAAQAQLAELFAEHPGLNRSRATEAVAASVGADARTLARWIVRLVKKGLADPRPDPEKKFVTVPTKKPTKKKRAKKAKKKVFAA